MPSSPLRETLLSPVLLTFDNACRSSAPIPCLGSCSTSVDSRYDKRHSLTGSAGPFRSASGELITIPSHSTALSIHSTNPLLKVRFATCPCYRRSAAPCPGLRLRKNEWGQSLVSASVAPLRSPATAGIRRLAGIFLPGPLLLELCLLKPDLVLSTVRTGRNL